MNQKNMVIAITAVLFTGFGISIASAMSTENTPSIMTPIKQLMQGVPIHDIKCNTGLSLVIKMSNNSPACVKPATASRLVAIGWAMSQNATIYNKSENTTSNNAVNDTPVKNSNPQMNVQDTNYKKAPGLVGITGYINTTPEKLSSDMKGKVILYQFWTFNCINCIHTLPHIVDLQSKYGDKGLLIIGIHSPETVFEKDPQNVQNAVVKYGIRYPVVLDTNYQTWNAFGNHYWPREYLVDPSGNIRFDHIGEGGYDDMEKEIQNLLAENS